MKVSISIICDRSTFYKHRHGEIRQFSWSKFYIIRSQINYYYFACKKRDIRFILIASNPFTVFY
jgi:hypothetical protein